MVRFAGSQARAIGAEIRKYRESLGWTLDQVGERTGISRSTLSRIETGVRRASVDEVASILTALSIKGTGKEKLISLASDGSTNWVGIGAGISHQLTAVSVYENEARHIYELTISIFPGLIQTSEYARALISTSPMGSAERERRVFSRVGRQAVLTRPGLETYCAYVDEAAFQRKTSNPRVMRGQLEHLIQVGNQPRISIRVLPFDAGFYWGCEGSFNLYSLDKGRCVVYQENRGTGVFIEDEDTETYKNVLSNLDGIALSPGESRNLINGYLERCER
jgi:transcriptional regulator with XRE-family HTH domain